MLYVNYSIVIPNMKKADVMRAWHMTAKYSTHLQLDRTALFLLASQVWITNGVFQKWELVELSILYGRLRITG